MLINIKLFLRLLYLSFFKYKDTQFRFGIKRIRFFIVFPIAFIYAMISSRLGFLLDTILFRGFKKQSISNPIFIISNFRSGTTLLYRLLAKDTETFTCFKTWEIYLAPSIAQRKFFRGILIVDKLIGGLITHQLKKIEQNLLSPIKLHRMGLAEPEEDEGILLYIWNSLWLLFMFPIIEEMKRYFYFDENMSSSQKKTIMKFYINCLKRHLYAHGGNKIFLSKNPSFSPRIDTILKYFPDAKIIYMTRNPMELFPSHMNWFSCCWSWFNDLNEIFPFKKEMIEMCKYWYLYPMKRLTKEPKKNYKVIYYNELINKPEQIVRDIYKQFGLQLNNTFEKTLKVETEKAKSFKTNRVKTPAQIGFTRKQLIDAFSEVYNHFGFDITKE